MKVYISGAITGTDDYMERFAKAENELTAKGWSVVKPAKVNGQQPEDTNYEEYMKTCLWRLDMRDSICMLKWWEKSCGANRELRYAMANKKTVFYEYELMNE